MPMYDFRCRACGAEVTLKATVSEKEAGLECSQCGSRDLQQLLRSLNFVGSTGGPGPMPPMGGAPGCMPGGGCCG